MFKIDYNFENQNGLRQSLDQYLKINGIKAAWICKQIGLSDQRLSHWRHGRENLTDENYIKLIKFLTQR